MVVVDSGEMRIQIHNNPSARYGHSTALVNDSLFLFAGKGYAGMAHELHKLATANLSWSLVEEGGVYLPREGSVSQKMSSVNNKIFVFGGSSDSSGFASHNAGIKKLIVL
eukprot:678459-Hanusia_phi.AAC.1